MRHERLMVACSAGGVARERGYAQEHARRSGTPALALSDAQLEQTGRGAVANLLRGIATGQAGDLPSFAALAAINSLPPGMSIPAKDGARYALDYLHNLKMFDGDPAKALMA